MKRFLLALAMALCLPVSIAAPINAPVPTNAYLPNFAGTGLDVAWADPCPVLQPSCGEVDLSYQSTLGWRLATAAEVAILTPILDGFDFVFPGANVPIGTNFDPASGANFAFGSPGGDAACASPYFSPYYLHCDWGNAPGTGGGAVPWGFGAGVVGYEEGIVVRNHAPEPGMLMLMGAAALGLGAVRRRRP